MAFNLELGARIVDAASCLRRQKYDQASTHLTESKKNLQERNKLIIISDREDWLTASEFQKDSLTSGGDDEKRLKNARKSARKIRERYAAKSKQRDFSSIDRTIITELMQGDLLMKLSVTIALIMVIMQINVR